jgi:hypothetical protein
VLVAVILGVAACAAPAADTPRPAERFPAARPRVALFPVENLSGRPAPLDVIRQLLALRLQQRGVSVLEDDALERILTAHRVRYTGGVGPRVARALRDEGGVEGVVIASLEAYDAVIPPRVALFARLVSVEDIPVVRWVGGAGGAGDDEPGLLGLGLVEDAGQLAAEAVESVAQSVATHLDQAVAGPGDRPGRRKFRPKIVYRSDALDPGRRYSVAVVPFFNKTPRKYAGEIVGLHMMRSFMRFPNISVVEPGVVREELLRFRIIMTDGISLPDTETILRAVNADLVLNGEVLDYQDRLDGSGAPRVDFAVLFIERRTRRVVYSSYSHNRGDDGVFFFDWGRVNTAHAMAAQMAGAVGERMLHAPATVEPRREGR